MPAATSASTWLWGLGVLSSIFTLRKQEQQASQQQTQGT
jgi:hypothetical protein